MCSNYNSSLKTRKQKHIKYLWPNKKYSLKSTFHDTKSKKKYVMKKVLLHLLFDNLNLPSFFSWYSSLLYSNTMFACMYVCLQVCLHPIFSGTAGTIWINLFLLVQSWSGDSLRPKKSRFGIRFFQNFGKTWIWGIIWPILL